MASKILVLSVTNKTEKDKSTDTMLPARVHMIINLTTFRLQQTLTQDCGIHFFQYWIIAPSPVTVTSQINAREIDSIHNQHSIPRLEAKCGVNDQMSSRAGAQYALVELLHKLNGLTTTYL